jgi:hypothetical protein
MAAYGFLVTALLWLSGCAGTTLIHKRGVVDTYANPDYDGNVIRTMGLLAGDQTSMARQMTARVRRRLEAAGLTILRTSGNWDSEVDALVEICAQQEPSPDGVVVIKWDSVKLRMCQTGHPRAFEARGAYEGLEELTDQLLSYLGLTPRGKS